MYARRHRRAYAPEDPFRSGNDTRYVLASDTTSSSQSNARFFCTGELFALDDLAATCEELGRYTFFFTSAPLNVPGGVASPPNGLCIF